MKQHLFQKLGEKSRIHVLMPADYISLTVLVQKLGFCTGILKAGEFRKGEYGKKKNSITVWYQNAESHQLMRVDAEFLESNLRAWGEHFRRNFGNIHLKFGDGSKKTLGDEDFIKVGLETTAEYGGWDIEE